jgi:hypothetical protein
MFVKIQRPIEGSESVYECERLHVTRKDADDPPWTAFDLESKDGYNTVTIVHNSEPTTVYVMNDHGKTIDSYHFGQDPRCPRAEAAA